MSISAMKQAVEALENYVNVVTSSNDPKDFGGVVDGGEPARQAITALRQAIAEAEKQEPVGYLYDWLNPDDRDEVIRDWFAESMYVIEKDKGFNVRPLYDAPVHAVDISQERVDETAKRKHEPVAWHEPGAYGNVTTHKDWALANGWEPLYKERT
jgi:hypothetical protein